MQSLSRRFLIGVGIMSLAVTVLGALGTFAIFQQNLLRRQVDYLDIYVSERSSNVDRRFTNLINLQTAASRELVRRSSQLSPGEVDRLMDLYFPLRPDGTRRSRARYFDGQQEQDGHYVYGMGAFMSQASTMSDRDRRLLAAAFSVVSDFGQAAHSEYDNFYFFTPETRMVMFGPDRQDRLLYYRETAPASLSIAKEEMTAIIQPGPNPTGVTVCTKLQRLLQARDGERLGTGCLTPVYLDNKMVGAFGSSIELSGFFQNAVRNTMPGATSLVVTGDGDLIAYPGFDVPGRASEKTLAGFEADLGLKTLIEAIHDDGRDHGVITSPDGRKIVAYGRLRGPDWYLLLTYPKADLTLSAARSASWILILGLLAAIAQTLLVVALARSTIVVPLSTLAETCDADSEVPAGLLAIESRPDEIGVLARGLRDERMKVHDVLASLEERVAVRTEELQRANEEKSRFLANMSHELRTPLNGVIAISESLAQEQVTERGRELAGLISSSGRLLEQVLSDVLDFSKIEAGEIQLSEEVFDLAAVVGGIAQLHRASAEVKGLDFTVEIDPAALGTYRGDPVRLTQVLSNLFSNSVKFTEAGAVGLSVTRCDKGLRFEVRDSGIGFGPEVAARLFRRFEQADASIRRRFGGTGLGLAICRSLVERMGGEIHARSEPGLGSQFTFELPLQVAEALVPDDPRRDQIDTRSESLRVLLAEDHPTNQKVVQLILNSVGVEPVIVENGALALECLRAESFDVILMDMQMPELDGLSAVEQWRAIEIQEGRPRTPVIMLTANALDEHVAASRDAGADDHLAKPIRAAALIAVIEALVAGPDPESTSGASHSQSA